MIKGIGCDIVAIKRIKNILSTCPTFLTHVYSDKELEEYQHRNKSVYYLASRFAAKEAIVKALSKYNNKLNTIEILNDSDGKPYVLINHQIQPQILISISYEREYVLAYAILSSI